MKSLIDVFRMGELSKETRVLIIKKLGQALNMQYASNITDGLVAELVWQLERKDQEYDIPF